MHNPGVLHTFTLVDRTVIGGHYVRKIMSTLCKKDYERTVCKKIQEIRINYRQIRNQIC